MIISFFIERHVFLHFPIMNISCLGKTTRSQKLNLNAKWREEKSPQLHEKEKA